MVLQTNRASPVASSSSPALFTGTAVPGVTASAGLRPAIPPADLGPFLLPAVGLPVCVVQLQPCRLLCSQKLLQMTVWLQWAGSGSWAQETFTNQKNKCKPFTVFTARSHVHTGNVPPGEPSLLMIHPMSSVWLRLAERMLTPKRGIFQQLSWAFAGCAVTEGLQSGAGGGSSVSHTCGHTAGFLLGVEVAAARRDALRAPGWDVPLHPARGSPLTPL